MPSVREWMSWSDQEEATVVRPGKERNGAHDNKLWVSGAKKKVK